MSIAQSFVMAIKSLMTSKVRALLTMLGIIIGVAAVIAILSLGEGMNTLMVETFEDMGSNLIITQVWGFSSNRMARPEDMFDLVLENPTLLAGVTPEVSVQRGTVKYGNTSYSTSTLTGVSESFGKIRNRKVEQGRFLSYADVHTRQNVCIVGTYVQTEILGGSALGKQLKINGYNYTVIGVLEEKADSGEYGDDNVIFIPYTNALKINQAKNISMYRFSAVSDTVSDRARALIENRLLEIYGNSDNYYVMNMAEVMEMASSLQGTLITVISAIAAISLLVGGIGIMNIMLVSVTERTREIGIRKSLGAKRRDIRGQFIIEAATTSAIGGIIGILLGIFTANTLGNAFDMKATPTLFSIILAFGVSTAIGVIFGFLPANKAATLNPIDALRYE